MSKLLAILMSKEKIEEMPLTKVGNPTIVDGVVSGFSASNYLALQQPFTLSSTTKAEIVIKAKSTQFVTGTSVLGTFGSYGISLQMTSNLHLYIGDGSSWNIVNNLIGTTTLSVDTNYWVKIIIDNNNISLLLSTDGITYTTEATTTKSISQSYNYNLTYGVARLGETYFRGSIDIPNSYIKLGSTKYKLQAVVGYTVVGSPTITDGVVSGFTTSDYVRTLNFPTTYDSIEFVTKVKANVVSVNTSNSVFALGNANITQNKFYLYFSLQQVIFRYRSADDNTTKNLTVNYVSSANTFYYIRVRIYTNKIILGISTDKINWVEKEVTDSIIMALSQDLRYGVIPNNAWALDGSIDFSETYIKVNNKLYFNGQPA